MQRREINVFLLNYCYYVELYYVKTKYCFFWLNKKSNNNTSITK